MNCRDAETLLLAERDGALNETQRADLERHVAGCEGCRQLRANLAAALAEFHADSASVRPPDAELEWRALQDRVHGRRAQPASRRAERKLAPLTWFAGPMAVAAAIALGFFLARPAPLSNETETELSPFAGYARANFVEIAVEDASPIVYVDKESGWLVVWADVADDNSHG